MWQSVIKLVRKRQQGAFGEYANQLPAIFRRKGRGGQGLGSFCGEITCQPGEFFVKTLALQNFAGFSYQHRRGIDGSKSDVDGFHMPKINIMAEQENEKQFANIFLLLVAIKCFIA